MSITCANCSGRGSLSFEGKTSTCPVCYGSGSLPDVYRFRLTNEVTGAYAEVTFRAAEARTTRDGRQVEIRPTFDDACARIGVSEATHFLYVRGHPIEFDAYVADWYMMGEETPPLAMARHFAWHWEQEPAGAVIDLRFQPRQPTEQLLDELWAKVTARGFGYGLVVSEGNIATGERGWDVILTALGEVRGYRSLGLAYELAVALREALDNVDKALKNTLP